MNFGRAWAGYGCRKCFDFSCQCRSLFLVLLRPSQQTQYKCAPTNTHYAQAHSQPAELPKSAFVLFFSGDIFKGKSLFAGRLLNSVNATKSSNMIFRQPFRATIAAPFAWGRAIFVMVSGCLVMGAPPDEFHTAADLGSTRNLVLGIRF